MIKSGIEFFTLFLSVAIFTFCSQPDQLHLVNDVTPYNEEGLINVIVEIPAGTLHKYEVDKVSGKARLQEKNGQSRIIQYLPYPGNYGMIPQTLLPKDKGGDGDPLDVIVLGPGVSREVILPCKIIGVLKLLDGGEQDDKLIAVSENSPLFDVESIKELKVKHNGALEILELWFTNYKGKGEVISQGFETEWFAKDLLEEAIKNYKSNN